MKHFAIFLIISLLYLLIGPVLASELATSLSPLEVAKNITNRSASDARVGYMHFTMRNKSGSERKRTALLIHAQKPSQTKIGIYFTKPAGLQNTSFLSHDNKLDQDQNWLYLPATDRVRKLPSSSRSDYFMGTDLSYGDIKDNFKFALEDWDFNLVEQQIENDKTYYILQGTPKNEAVKQELGYASFTSKIDPKTWFPVSIRYTDLYDAPLKDISITELEMVANTWIATHFTVLNLQTSHQTEIILSDMQSLSTLPANLLTAEELAYGVPQMKLAQEE